MSDNSRQKRQLGTLADAVVVSEKTVDWKELFHLQQIETKRYRDRAANLAGELSKIEAAKKVANDKVALLRGLNARIVGMRQAAVCRVFAALVSREGLSTDLQDREKQMDRSIEAADELIHVLLASDQEDIGSRLLGITEAV